MPNVTFLTILDNPWFYRYTTGIIMDFAEEWKMRQINSELTRDKVVNALRREILYDI